MGFHIMGVLIPLIILLPNLLFMLYPPKDMPGQKEKEPLWLTVLENIGRIICFLYPIVFGVDVSNAIRLNSALPYVMALCILAYYCLWARYFIHGRRFALLFRPLFFLPIPMAVFPALYFLALSILLQSLIMGVAAAIFAASHIALSRKTYRQLQKDGSAV